MTSGRSVERSSAGSAVGGALTGGVRGATTATAGDAVLTRLVDLQPGQQLQATVVTAPADGRVRIGLLGGLVDAMTTLALEPGRTYQFTVAAVSPQIVLSTARPVVLPGMTNAAAAGALGVSGAGVAVLAASVASSLAGEVAGATTAPVVPGARPGFLPSPDAARHDAAAFDTTQFWRALQHAAPEAAEWLRAFQRRFGHDHEARVLRLPASTDAAGAAAAATAAAELRLDGKSIALLARAAAPDSALAAERVAAMNGIERDDAMRAQQGLPQWLPIPAFEAMGVRDARMFVLPDPGGDRRRGDGAATPFTIVLLLDLTALGAIRADVALRETNVEIGIVVAQDRAAAVVRAGLDELVAGLRSAEFDVAPITITVAPSGRLPISDLVHLPVASASGLVDVHV